MREISLTLLTLLTFFFFFTNSYKFLFLTQTSFLRSKFISPITLFCATRSIKPGLWTHELPDRYLLIIVAHPQNFTDGRHHWTQRPLRVCKCKGWSREEGAVTGMLPASAEGLWRLRGQDRCSCVQCLPGKARSPRGGEKLSGRRLAGST